MTVKTCVGEPGQWARFSMVRVTSSIKASCACLRMRKHGNKFNINNYNVLFLFVLY